MTPTLEADPDCARPAAPRAEWRRLDAIDPDAWDDLAEANPWATPFSSWAFHRAWWDAYGANAHEQTLVVLDGAGRTIGIAPLMHRHAVEPGDAGVRTTIRHGSPADLTPVAPTAKVVYLGATYHADYATLLAAPDDVAPVGDATIEAVCDLVDPDHPVPWDVLDLRRLRTADPAIEALAAAVRRHEIDEGWTLNIEREDVCPVVHLPDGADLDSFLATLGKTARHEIRRKVRRAAAAGPIELVESSDPLADLDSFVELHQRRWGAEGLFPDTAGGAQSRIFMRRLFELFAARAGRPGHPSVHLSFLSIGGRRVAASLHFEARGTLYYYNAGIDPEARALSPGVVLLEQLVRRALARGLTRLDLMRGDEPYKYEWGAIDEPVERLLVRRRSAA